MIQQTFIFPPGIWEVFDNATDFNITRSNVHFPGMSLLYKEVTNSRDTNAFQPTQNNVEERKRKERRAKNRKKRERVQEDSPVSFKLIINYLVPEFLSGPCNTVYLQDKKEIQFQLTNGPLSLLDMERLQSASLRDVQIWVSSQADPSIAVMSIT